MNMSYVSKLASGLLVLAMSWSTAAVAAEGWEHSRKLVLDTTPVGGDVKEAVSQVPVLVRLHSGNFIFAEAKPDGSDLRFFAADNTTPLKYHFERYDATNELAVAWVQLPKLAPNATTDAIWVHWGNPEAAAADDAKGTYDAQQAFVLNFSEAAGFKDVSASGNHPTTSTAKPVAAGPIGGAAAFDGQAKVVLAASPSLKLAAADGWTFTAWVKPAALESGGLLAMGQSATGLTVALRDGVLLVQSGGAEAKASAPLKAGVWQHMAVVAQGGKVSFFVNGAPTGEGALPAADIDGEVVLGAGFKGELDAVGLARTARSAAHVKALASSEMADSPMMAFADDSEEGGEGGEVSYFKILIGAVTVDGWVVIGFLGILAIMSLWVMITKTRILNRTEKANAIFLDLFQQKSVHLLDPDHADAKALKTNGDIADSTIYQLYAVGLNEIAQRFESQSEKQQARALSSTSLESIRASLDAAIVRTNQRFNQGIVILTIAIAGGPFLGLLGTVVGVMITFAAIAAAGDVNVNAIAPGIAAALVATVAGLAVAIPALFAYNWFTIKIKNISADTQVFADEFLTKSAELHAG
jgi:biopolymer transport protein ExbB